MFPIFTKNNWKALSMMTDKQDNLKREQSPLRFAKVIEISTSSDAGKDNANPNTKSRTDYSKGSNKIKMEVAIKFYHDSQGTLGFIAVSEMFDVDRKSLTSRIKKNLSVDAPLGEIRY